MPHPNPNNQHEPPYPLSTLDYRLRELERWKEKVEHEGIVTTLAVMKSEMRVLRTDVDTALESAKATQQFINMAKGEEKRTKNLIVWVMAIVALLGVALPYLVGVPGA
jgi:hypothetical protein